MNDIFIAGNLLTALCIFYYSKDGLDPKGSKDVRENSILSLKVCG